MTQTPLTPQNLVQQTISFTSTTNFDTNPIANSYMQNVANNSQNGVITMEFRQNYHWNGTNFDIVSTSCLVHCYVTLQFSSQIQQTLNQLQALLPMYTIVTYATNISYGT